MGNFRASWLKQAISIFVVIILQIQFSMAGPQTRIVKNDLVAHAGSCSMKMSDFEARSELSKNNIKSPGAKSEEDIALAKTIARINQLNGGPFAPFQGVTVKFARTAINNDGELVDHSFQKSSKVVQMCRGNHEHVGSVGYLAHELGHVLGNTNNAEWYSSYKSKVSVFNRCRVSNYAEKKEKKASKFRNEEFAEAFAAFVANPKLLKDAGGGCIDALNYFQGRFKQSMLASCDVEQSTILANAAVTKKSDFTLPDEDHALPDETQKKITDSNSMFKGIQGILPGLAMALTPLFISKLSSQPAPAVVAPAATVAPIQSAGPGAIPGSR